MNFRSALFAALVFSFFFIAVPAVAQEWGAVYEVTSNLNVRAKRTPKSDHVVTLSKGERVKVDFIQNGWGAVFDVSDVERKEALAIGYVNIRYLTLVEKAEVVMHDTAAVAAAPVAQTETQGEGAVKAAVDQAPPAPITVGVDPSRMPVEINADKMTYDETGKVVSFVGNVVAKHGELTLWAQQLSAYFSSRTNKKFAADGIDRIIAEGSVRVKRGKTEGTCGKLTYAVGSQLLTMERDPLLQDGPNSLAGEVIVFHIRENRSEVIGGAGKRVKAIFMAPAQMKGQ